MRDFCTVRRHVEVNARLIFSVSVESGGILVERAIMLHVRIAAEFRMSATAVVQNFEMFEHGVRNFDARSAAPAVEEGFLH